MGWLPTLLAAVLAFTLHLTIAPALGEQHAPGAASPWLVFPMVVASLTCAVTAAVFWPTFARGRPGQQWVERLQRGPLRGSGGAMAGALLAQWLLTVPLTTALALALGAPSSAVTHLQLQPEGQPVLAADRPPVSFTIRDPQPFTELRLRPLAGLPTSSLVPTIVEVFADGESLGTMPAPFAETRQLVRLPFSSRSMHRLELVHKAGTVPLVFVPGAVTLRAATAHWSLSNGLLAALLALLPSFVAMALASWCGLLAGLPTVIAVVASGLFVQTIVGLGPFEPTMLALMRGHWLATSAVFQPCAASLTVGSMAMILAMLLRRRVRR